LCEGADEVFSDEEHASFAPAVDPQVSGVGFVVEGVVP
jgi:hypothetical protein